MYLSAPLLRRVRRYPVTRDFIKERHRTGQAPPRSLPHAPNYHFENNGLLHSPIWGHGQHQKGYHLRYSEKQNHGRVSHNVDYTAPTASMPLYKRLSCPENILDSANNPQIEIMTNQEVQRRSNSDIDWYKENWHKLDLIDPARWTLFPGDVVIVTNKFHPDYLKFGRISRIYMPHGYIWVNGLNKQRGWGVSENRDDSVGDTFLPFNYRDLKMLKYGNHLMAYLTNPKEGMEQDGFETKKLEPEQADMMTTLDKIMAEHIKSVNACSDQDGNFVLGETELLESDERLKNDLLRSGMLEHIDLDISYRNFSTENFHNMSWHELGAVRVNWESKEPVELPEKLSTHSLLRGETPHQNEMTASDFQKLIEVDTEGKTKMERFLSLHDPPLARDHIRQHFNLKPETEDETVYLYRSESDKYDI